ncbi:MAG TPA: tetratricopeptide repeat protein [Candidatus Binatia bacterium]|jgi:tetratricopeptide (TPR) repeat protein|nr:tetratricopeptide repeat protein [Candidatus Binatia bacterium]
MLRSCGVSLIGVLALAISLAYGQASSVLPDKEKLEQGKKFLAEGKITEAKAFFEDLITRNPKDPDVYLFLGIVTLRLREPETAEVYIRKALALHPDHLEARTLMGWLNLEVKRDYAAAIADYDRVVQLRPDLPEAYNNLGVAFKKKGEMEKALANFNRALELRENYGEARSNRGWVYAEQRKWREAREDFEQVLRIHPRDEGALYGLSHALKEERDYPGAQQALRQLMAQSANFVYWLEWAQLQLVRFYWVFLLAAGAIFLHSRYRRVRRESHGG